MSPFMLLIWHNALFDRTHVPQGISTFISLPTTYARKPNVNDLLLMFHVRADILALVVVFHT